MQCALLACCEVYAAVQSHLHCCLGIAPPSAMVADVAWPMERSLLKAAFGGRYSQQFWCRRRLTMAKVLLKAAIGGKCSQHD